MLGNASPGSPSPVAAKGRCTASGVTRGLAALAALAGALTAAELFRAGLPFGPLHKPLIYPLAAVAALSGAGWLWRRRGRAALPACVAAAVFVAYLANDQRLTSGDTRPATLIPYALVRNGTLALDGLVRERPIPGWVEERDGHLWSHYPVTAGLMALPVYLPAALGPGVAGALPQAEKLAAASLAAASVGFLLATLLGWELPLGLALLATGAYAFGSPVLCTAAQALWQHTTGVLALSAGLWCTVRSRSDPRFEPWAGLCAGLAVAARATNVFPAAALLAWQAPRGWRPAARSLAAAAVPVSLVASYNALVFGAPWRTGYGSGALDFGGDFASGLLGVLFSPTRGLFTYVPWAALAILGLVIGARRERLFGLALGGVVAIVVVHSWWRDWPGGWCFGPRLLCDGTPLLALGLGPLLAPSRRRWVVPCLLATATFSAWLAWMGAFRQYTPVGHDVYLGAGAHAMEWWRYPPLRMARSIFSGP